MSPSNNPPVLPLYHLQAHYHLQAELENAFDEIIARIEKLIEVYRQEGGAAWALEEVTPDAEWLRRILLDFWYEEGQDGRVTRSYISLIAAGEGLLNEVGRVNHAKAQFSEVLERIRHADAALIPGLKATLPRRHPALNSQLRDQGLARLHLKQCWRALPSADAPLSRVRLAWYASGRSIKKLSVREAESKLASLDVDAPHIRIQLRHLAGIPDGEPLAQVQKQAPLMRANIFFAEPLADGRNRRAMNVALPLFIPSPDGRLPDYNRPPPFPQPERTRAKRSDERLEDEPFLPSIRVYRYR